MKKVLICTTKNQLIFKRMYLKQYYDKHKEHLIKLGFIEKGVDIFIHPKCEYDLKCEIYEDEPYISVYWETDNCGDFTKRYKAEMNEVGSFLKFYTLSDDI
jgi:hypothetical protein